MSDRQFLIWIHDRLRLHGDSADADYMGRLRSIINGTPQEQVTPNTAPRIEMERD